MKGLRFIDSQIQMPLTPLPVRTVVATVSTGAVMLSPGSRLTEASLQTSEPVTDVVAPTLMHLGGVGAAAKVHPGARLWGPKGARERSPKVPWSHILGVDPWPHAAELAPFEVAGAPSFNEVVFLHRPSRTLLVSDLAFNILDSKGIGGRIIFGLFGTYRRFGVSRLYLRGVKDRGAFAASVKRLVAEPFENLVPSHGTPLQGGAQQALIQAMKERGVPV